jgi:hypothetical protein
MYYPRRKINEYNIDTSIIHIWTI